MFSCGDVDGLERVYVVYVGGLKTWVRRLFQGDLQRIIWVYVIFIHFFLLHKFYDALLAYYCCKYLTLSNSGCCMGENLINPIFVSVVKLLF